MAQLVVDPATIAKLRGVNELTEIRDESGAVLGFYYPVTVAEHAGRVQSPHSREELEELRKQRQGRPLADILKDLGAQ